jgi:hypothetical protein
MPAYNPDTQFVLCIENTDYPAALERRKLYQVLPDAAAATHGLLRVVDESGEDYLYPSTWFVPLQLPAEVQAALVQAA